MVKKTLWIFGDSMSAPFSNAIKAKWLNPYLQKLDTDRFHFWSEIVGEQLGMLVENHAVGGVDNSSIMEKFSQNADNLNNGDVVIVNWTNISRFRIPINTDFSYVVPNCIPPELLEHGIFTEEEIKKVIVSRNHPLFQVEVNMWSNLINEFCKLKNITTIFWGICDFQSYFFVHLYDLNNIPGGLRIVDDFPELDDHHFSLNGHKIFAEKVIQRLQSNIEYTSSSFKQVKK
jgi:hypothetical protein